MLTIVPPRYSVAIGFHVREQKVRVILEIVKAHVGEADEK